MLEKFILVTRNIRGLLHEQIACADFDGHWDYTPYKEFNSAGDRVWSNLMSAEWAAKEAVCVPSL
jgi:Plavaka transposase